MPETHQAYRKRFAITWAIAALLFCSFLPIWQVEYYGRRCGLSVGTTFWHMLAMGWRADPPDGQWPVIRCDPIEGAIFTIVIVAITYFVGRWYAKGSHPNFR